MIPTMTERLQKAIDTASRLHAGQLRKGDGDLPYISHPFSVAWILGRHTADEDILVAALLHDVLEDVPGYGYEDLRNDFGEEAARIVRELTEDKDPNVESDGRATWQYRKETYLQMLIHDSEAALMVCAADKIHNLRSMSAAYAEQGESLWQQFNSPPEKKLWYYEEVLKVLQERLASEIVQELEMELERTKRVLKQGNPVV